MTADNNIISGGVSLESDATNIGGDVVGRDKIIQIQEHALTTAQTAKIDHNIQLQYLAEGVAAFVGDLRQAAASSGEHTGTPYRDLLEFRLSDAAIFRGRERAIQALFERFKRARLTILHSQSGEGKTSLLKAGLSPRLIEQGCLPVYLRPYDESPVDALKKAFVRVSLNNVPELASASLHEFLLQVKGLLGRDTYLYIFIDQFEELFTRVEESRRGDFARELAECLDDDSLNVNWLLSLRGEYFGRLAEFQPRILHPFENEFYLSRLQPDEARDAISEPACSRGVTFEAGLIDTIINDLGKTEIAPPELQLVCSALYKSLSKDALQITYVLYEAQGGAARILGEYVEQVFQNKLLPTERPLARRILEELITSDSQRIIRSKTELECRLIDHQINKSMLTAILDRLVSNRLLCTHQSLSDNEPAFELAHDYLLTKIQLSDETKSRKGAQELLEQETRNYLNYKTLLSDDKLAIISPWLRDLPLTDDEHTLVDKSIKALKRRQNLIRGSIGLAILFISVAVFVGLIAQTQLVSATDARRVAEAAAADSIIQKQTAQAGAASGQAEAATAQAVATKAQAAASSAKIAQATSEAGANNAAAREKQANMAAAIASTREASANQSLQVLFSGTGVVAVGNAPSALAYDGQLLWVANRNENLLQAIEPATGLIKKSVKVGVNPIALLFDGNRLWVANQGDSTIQSVDVVNGTVSQPIGVGQYPIALAYDSKYNRIWIVCVQSNSVQPFNLTSAELEVPVQVGQNPSALVIDDTSLWVANSQDGTIQVIDLAKNEAGEPLSVGRGPRALAFDGKDIWVANTEDNTVQRIDPSTRKTFPPIQIGTSPIALMYDEGHLWVANMNGNSVKAIDPSTGQIGTFVAVGAAPSALAFDGNHLWVANSVDNTVQVINLAAGTVSTPILVGNKPSAVINHKGQLWVANSNDNTVSQVDLSTSQLNRTVNVGNHPVALAFAGERLWVVNAGDGTVQAIEPSDGSTTSVIEVGKRPSAIAYDDKWLWVANYDDNTIVAIDPNSARIVAGPINVESGPLALAVAGDQLWVACATSNAIQALDLTTIQLQQPIDIKVSPWAMVFDGTQLWVASRTANSVLAVDVKTKSVGMPVRLSSGPTALAFDGVRIWIANYDYSSVQSLDPKNSVLGVPIRVDGGPIDLAFDGERRLWVVNQVKNTVQNVVTGR